MDPATAFAVAPAEERPGAFAHFPFDRELLERFKAEFPQARWKRREERWFVPGTTAAARLERWMAVERSALGAHADARGRDAFQFEPLRSPYLAEADDLLVRTPYSRAVVALLRTIPPARWDPAIRAWRVPYRALEELRRVWPEIEAIAGRGGPDARAERRKAAAGDLRAAAVARERRRRRAPVSRDTPPPLGEPVSTPDFGVVVFEALDLEPIEPATPSDGGTPVWGHWRMPTWREIAAATPAPAEGDRSPGWWPPVAEELAERKRRMREAERARSTRRGEAPD